MTRMGGPGRTGRRTILLAAGIVAAAGSLLADEHPGGTGAPDSSGVRVPAFEVHLKRARVAVTGDVLSAGHARDLEQAAGRLFPGVAIGADLAPNPAAPLYWRDGTHGLLEVLATLRSGRAVMSPASIELSGITLAADDFRRRLESLRASMPAGIDIRDGVTVIVPDASLQALCSDMFARIADAKIEFSQASAELRSSAYGLLDRLVEFSFDCPGWRIAITGHTDASGDEAWNRQLSLERARAVADYLVAAGVEPDRLRVEGRGSADPVADNDTEIGRRTNRRIEFTLKEDPLDGSR